MAGIGPAPTPTPILEARGSPVGAARRKAGEPRPRVKHPACPRWLGREAKAEWRRQVKQLDALGLSAEVDRALLAAYCDAWGELVTLDALLTKAGGVKEKNWRILLQKGRAREQVLKLGQQFGFSPASRTRVRASAPEVEGHDRSSYFAAGEN